MRNNTRKKIFKWLPVVLLIFIMFMPLNVSAAAAKTKACRAYSRFLSQKELDWYGNGKKIPSKDCSFSLAYIDNNSVPELIVLNKNGSNLDGFYAVFTYRGGKIVPCGRYTNFAYYRKKGIIYDNVLSAGVDTTSYRKLAKGKVSWKLAKSVVNIGIRRTYYTYYNASGATEHISEKSYNAHLKKLVGSQKKRYVKKMYVNSAANRKNYLIL